MSTQEQFWVVIPAAGKGTRMGSPIPKQYLLIEQRPVIAYTLEVFLQHESIAGVVVVSQDTLPVEADERIHSCAGGAERWQSVLNGLCYLRDELKQKTTDWVLVHDAARPCLRAEDLSLLIKEVTQQNTGGLLGIPVADTLKKVANQRVQATVDRSQLWRALTPQMFALGELITAIENGQSQELSITDEASAIESMGQQPLMVQGQADNIKITLAEDLALAELFLRRMGRIA